MKPEGGGPNMLGWFILASALAFASYQTHNRTKASREIAFQDFVNNYLASNQVEMITLSENRDNSAFKYRATIKLIDGTTHHMVMP